MGDNYPYLHGRVPNSIEIRPGELEDPGKRRLFGDTLKLFAGGYMLAAGAASKGEADGYNSSENHSGTAEKTFTDPDNLTMAAGAATLAAGSAPEIGRGLARREFTHAVGAVAATFVAASPSPLAYAAGYANGMRNAGEDIARADDSEKYRRAITERPKDQNGPDAAKARKHRQHKKHTELVKPAETAASAPPQNSL